MGAQQVKFLDDQGNVAPVTVTGSLDGLFSYAHQWALQEDRNDPYTLTFSSMLAAMTAGSDPVCAWLRSHLALRGVRPESMTKGRKFPLLPLPEVVRPSISFRNALAKAQQLSAADPDSGVDVRHFLAAYAVIPGYHLKKFLALRIDRRALCLELADYLASRFKEEKALWLKYAEEATPVPSLGFNTDAPEGRDLLNVDREVEAFARLIASRNTVTPLSVGVFGAWGSGKSFFMRRLRKRVATIAKLGEEEGAKSKYHGRIAQIDFNAWHYSEGNLAASFVDHILRNLQVKPDETVEQLRSRGEEIVQQLDVARENLALREQAVAAAEKLRDEKLQAVAQVDRDIAGQIEAKKGEIATAQQGVKSAQVKLSEELAALQTQIDEELKRAPAHTIANLALRRLNDPQFAQTERGVLELISEAKAANANRQRILYAAIVTVIGLTVAAIVKTNLYTQLVAAAAAVGSLAATALPWLRKLNAFAQKGKEFEEEQNRIRQAIRDEATAAHEQALTSLRAVANSQQAAVTRLTAELNKLEQAPADARLELASLEQKRADALAEHQQAAAVLEEKRSQLARLNTGTLLQEFLDDRMSNDGYLKELTIFSRIRNDFEKLSLLMTKSNDEFVSGKITEGRRPEPPVVSRIVLYIDDLDRCPADRVVEVLKLAHLLLAFPLFVCVLAVDPRWITSCLEKAPGLVDRDEKSPATKPRRDDFMAEFGEPATPSDYLEKIIQVPLWLRPVPLEYRAAIVRTLLDPAETSAEIEIPIVPSRVVEDGLEGVGRSETGEAAERRRLDPDLISSKELEYLDKLAGMLGGNPRSLKRFVNTYRLVKTSLSDVELVSFLQASDTDRGSYLPYPICMAQLAVLCTQRSRALVMIRHVDQAKGEAPLTTWLEDFDRTDRELAGHFRSALSTDLQAIDVQTFRRWLERTRRYSFYL